MPSISKSLGFATHTPTQPKPIPKAEPPCVISLDRILGLANEAGLTVINGGSMFMGSKEPMSRFVNKLIGQVTVTQNNETGEVLGVTLTDEEHRILKVIWQKERTPA